MFHTGSLGEALSRNLQRCDIVSWKKLGEKQNIGMIYEIYTVEMGGREIKRAKVASFKDTQHYDLLVLELKLVSKAK